MVTDPLWLSQVPLAARDPLPRVHGDTGLPGVGSPHPPTPLPPFHTHGLGPMGWEGVGPPIPLTPRPPIQ